MKPLRGRIDGIMTTKSHSLLFFAWMISSSFALSPSLATAELELSKEMNGIVATPYVSYLEDPDKSLAIEDVRKEPWTSRFSSPGSEKSNKSVSSSAWWVRLEAVNRTNEDASWLIQVPHTQFDYVELYYYPSKGPPVIYKLGDHLPMNEHPIPSTRVLFPISTPAGETGRAYIKFSFESVGLFKTQLRIWSPALFEENHKLVLFLNAIILGGAFVALIYNLFLALSFRSLDYFWYVLFVGSSITCLLTITGLGSRYFWPGSMNPENMLSIPMLLNFTFATLFTRTFLDIKSSLPSIDKILRSFVFLWVVCIVCVFVDLRKIAVWTCLISTLVTMSFPFLGFWLWRKGRKEARFYTVAWLVWAFAFLIAWMRWTGMIPFNFVTDFLPRFCFLAETLLLSLALADRINILQSAKDAAEQNARDTLECSRRELEHKVAERTTELAEAKDQAIAANQSKSDFLSMMSHEIRTPMNAIVGMTHLTLQTELTVKQQDYLGKVKSSAHSLLGIINDILDFSKIEAGKLDLEEVDFNLEDVLNNLSTLICMKAEEKGLEIHFATSGDVPLCLVGDSLRLGQILLNLANNAVKFTEKGEIVIKTELSEESKEGDTIQLKFTIMDTGIGLSSEKINTLFKSFTQADTSTTRKYGGTGLGLSICKRLVKMMGGSIHVESEPGKGSSFIFTANFHRQKEEKEKCFLPPVDIKGMRVLVVDDSGISRNILTSHLESFSLHVTTAASAKEGIHLLENALKDAPYHLVLMDWKMPEMNGIEASRLIKQNTQIPHPPTVIMVTAFDKDGVRRQAEDLQLDGFLVKPVNQSALFDAITNVFGKTMVKKQVMDVVDGGEREAFTHEKGAKILLVEDNAINRQVATELLKKEGFEITTAKNGKEAVHQVKENVFDLILMDLQMPEMDGYAATREIRRLSIDDCRLMNERELSISQKKQSSINSQQSLSLP